MCQDFTYNRDWNFSTSSWKQKSQKKTFYYLQRKVIRPPTPQEEEPEEEEEVVKEDEEEDEEEDEDEEEFRGPQTPPGPAFSGMWFQPNIKLAQVKMLERWHALTHHVLIVSTV